MGENRRIIDVHAHIGESISIGLAADAKKVIKIMDQNNITQGIPSPIPGYPDPKGIENTATQNDRVAEAVAKHPDRFPCGLGVLEPRHGEVCLKELHRAVKDLGLRGFMFHHDFMGCFIDHPIMYAMMEEAKQYPQVVIGIHTNQLSSIEPPFRFARLVEAYPEVTFIEAHPAMDPTHATSSIEIAKRNKNVYFDVCLLYHHDWPVERLVKELGADRLMFGSDIPYYDHCIESVIVENASVSDADKEKLFWQTAAKLFDIKS